MKKTTLKKIIEILFHTTMYQTLKDFNVLIGGKGFFDLPVKNEEKTYAKIIEMSRNNDYTTENNYIRELLDVSNQGVKRLFVLAYRDHGSANIVTADSHRGYSLPRIKIENCNIEIDRRNSYDQPINDLIKQYGEVRKVSTGQDDDYTTGCLLDFACFKKNYRLITADLSKKKL